MDRLGLEKRMVCVGYTDQCDCLLVFYLSIGNSPTAYLRISSLTF